MRTTQYSSSCGFTLGAGVTRHVRKFQGVFRLRTKQNKNRSYVARLLGSEKDTPFGFRWPKDSVCPLGIHFSNDRSTSDGLNFEKKLEDLQRILNSWERRKLTLFGKIDIVKSLGLSRLTITLQFCNGAWKFRQKGRQDYIRLHLGQQTT